MKALIEKLKTFNTMGGIFYAGVFVTLGYIYSMIIQPHSAGFFYDDAIYLLGARSLAEGRGLVLHGLIHEPLFTKYPPLWPFILSLGWRINPAFPDNVLFLKCINASFALLALAGFAYFWRKACDFSYALSALLILFLGTHLQWVNASTSLMSEPLYMLLVSLAGVLLVHIDKTTSLRWPHLIAFSAILIAAFHARTAAVFFIAPVLFWLAFIKKYDLKQVFVLGLLVGLGCLPWLIWVATIPKSAPIVYDEFMIRSFHETYVTAFTNSDGFNPNIPFTEALWQNFLSILNQLPVYTLPALKRFPQEPWATLAAGLFWIVCGFGVLKSVQSKNAIYPFILLYFGVYIAFLTCWGWEAQASRLALPVIPFVLTVLITGLKHVSASPIPRLFVLSSVFVLAIYSNLFFLKPMLARPQNDQLAFYQPGYSAVTQQQAKQDTWVDYVWLFDWIRQNTPANAKIWSDNLPENALIPLYTERFSADFYPVYTQTLSKPILKDPKQSYPLFVQRSQALDKMLKQYFKVDYVILNTRIVNQNQFAPVEYPKNDPLGMLWLELQPPALHPLAVAPSGRLAIYPILPEKTK